MAELGEPDPHWVAELHAQIDELRDQLTTATDQVRALLHEPAIRSLPPGRIEQEHADWLQDREHEQQRAAQARWETLNHPPSTATADRRPATRAHPTEAEASADEPHHRSTPSHRPSGEPCGERCGEATCRTVDRSKALLGPSEHTTETVGPDEPGTHTKEKDMTATPHRPTYTRDPARQRRAPHPARSRRPRARPRRHPALLAPPRLRTPSFRIGRTVRYWRSDVFQWLEKQSSHPHSAR